jgi:uncharacterized protein (DUF2235 family)
MKKRIVICCDGTWNTPEDPTPTNVVLAARSVLPAGKDLDTGETIPQIVFYDWGVGTGNLGERLAGGALGKGLNKNIQDAYRFIVHNYEKDDDLFVFGFSRGAYTARSLGGMIRNCGILKRVNAGKIPRAFRMYKSNAGPDCNTAVRFRNENAHHRDSSNERVSITFMGVWDTVGALGIPLKIFEELKERKYRFHDEELSSITKNAYHALAIDEKRRDFEPVLWSNLPKEGQKVGQIWFPGVHTDVGGGYEERGLGNGSLQWMMRKARTAGLNCSAAYLNRFEPDALDVVHKSRKGFYRFKRRLHRTIVQYNAPKPESALHGSVKERYRSFDYEPPKLVKYLEDNGIRW